MPGPHGAMPSGSREPMVNPVPPKGEARKSQVLSWHWVQAGNKVYPENLNLSPELPEVGHLN